MDLGVQLVSSSGFELGNDIPNFVVNGCSQYHRHWGALGALVIIGTVAFDPFLQAVLSAKGQLDTEFVDGFSAYVPQALAIDAGVVIELSGGPQRTENPSAGLVVMSGGTFLLLDFGMMSAVYNGFHNSTAWDGDGQVVNTFCATGNCTWPAFTSAAICSSCNDLTSKFTTIKRSGRGGQNVAPPTNAWLNGNYTTFVLPYANISNYDSILYDSPRRKVRTGVEPTLLTLYTTFDALETMSFQDLQTMIVAFTIIRASDDWISGKTPWNLSRPMATECALYLCTKIYQAQSLNSRFNETLLHSSAVRDPKSYQADPNSTAFKHDPGLDFMVAQRGNKLFDNQIPRTDLRLILPDTDYPEIEPRMFSISYAFITTLSQFLVNLTSGNRQVAFPAWDDGTPPLMDALWDSKNLTETFDHVARSITNQVRSTAANSSNIRGVPGTTHKWVIHVHVECAYLAFPIVMISLGIIYVILTIFGSTKLYVPVWKESALPSLLHGFDNETQNLLRNAQLQPTGLKLGATTVRLDYDEKDDCLRLIADRDTRY